MGTGGKRRAAEYSQDGHSGSLYDAPDQKETKEQGHVDKYPRISLCCRVKQALVHGNIGRVEGSLNFPAGYIVARQRYHKQEADEVRSGSYFPIPNRFFCDKRSVEDLGKFRTEAYGSLLGGQRPSTLYASLFVL